MKSLLIRQAVVVPLAAMLVPMLIAFALPGYSSISQHLSELEMLQHPVAAITRIASITSGVSIILFALGVVLYAPGRFAFTAICASLAGAAMVSNGVFVMGNPLHGLYGMALFMALVPACLAAELGQIPKLTRLSLAAAVLTMAYFWLQFSGLDPHGFRGLTQRVAVVVMFGWYSVAAYALMRHGVESPMTRAGSFPGRQRPSDSLEPGPIRGQA